MNWLKWRLRYAWSDLVHRLGFHRGAEGRVTFETRRGSVACNWCKKCRLWRGSVVITHFPPPPLPLISRPEGNES